MQNASFGAIFWSKLPTAVSLFRPGVWGTGQGASSKLQAIAFFDILKITNSTRHNGRFEVLTF